MASAMVRFTRWYAITAPSRWLNACKFLKAISVAAQMAIPAGNPTQVTVFQWRDDGTLITPERFVELTSAMPARLFLRWWPQKGLLAPGSDGDVVIIDPRQSQQIQHRHLHDNADYSPWRVLPVRARLSEPYPVGETIFCDGTFTGKAGEAVSPDANRLSLPCSNHCQGSYTIKNDE